MGQHKEVTVKRIVVRDTIEDRILKLQLAKQGLADAALGEGGARKNGKMTINDIKMVRSPALVHLVVRTEVFGRYPDIQPLNSSHI